MKTTYIKQITAFFLGLAVIILTVISGAGIAFAADNGSYVLRDLQTDRNFNAADYPEIINDYSLNVIQIAESTDGELLIYVYQPYGDMRASSINISRYPDNATTASFLNYRLEYLNSSETLYKYKVIGFDILGNALRVYNISNIMRPFDKSIDTKPTGGNTISEVPNAVGQCWTATTVNGTVTYLMTTSEVIEIKNKHVGYVNYDDGNNIGWAITSGATSAHFVAFSTNKKMDKLKSASLTFNERDVQYKYCCNPVHLLHGFKSTFDYVYKEPHAHEPNPLELHYTEKASNASGGYLWNRIQTTAEFLQDKDEDDIKLTNEAEGELSKTQWVLNFYETPVLVKTDNVWVPFLATIAGLFTGDADVKKTEISDVSILLLEFEKDGKTYKLGAVDNKQTGSLKPDGSNVKDNNDFWNNAIQWLKRNWWVIPVGIIAAVIAIFLIYTLALLIGSFLKWLITAPFRLFKRK